MTTQIVLDPKKLAASGLPANMVAAINQLIRLAQRPAIKGAPGRGIRNVVINPNTGRVAMVLTDGAVFQTDRLVGLSAYEVAVRNGFAGTEAEWIETQRGVNGEVLAVALDEPREVVALPDGAQGLLADRQNRVVVAQRETGLDFVPSTELVARLVDELPLNEPFDGPQGRGGIRPLMQDALGNILLGLLADGLDFEPSDQLTARLAEKLSISRSELSTTTVEAYTQQCQSLGPGGGYKTDLTRAQVIARAAEIMPGGYLMLGDLVNVDNQPIFTDGPRSKAYDRTKPASGLVTAAPPMGAVTAPFPLAVSLNAIRASYGLAMAPIVTTAHGIPGIAIEEIDDDPATGNTSSTLIWDNMSWYYDELKRVCAAAGRVLVVRWHDWLHGTSAKGSERGAYLARLWDYHADFHALLAAKGIDGPAVMVMGQPAGDANSSNDLWHCRDDVLDFCEQGGGILAVCEYWFEIDDNNVHPDARATILMQETRAWQVVEAEAGLPVTIRRPRMIQTPGTITLHFNSLRETEHLVMHDAAKYAGAGIDQWGGFELRGGGAVITGLQLMGHQVRITYTGAPQTLHYCQQWQDVTALPDNRFVAQRGLLRTSHTRPSQWFPDELLCRAVPAFNLQVEE